MCGKPDGVHVAASAACDFVVERILKACVLDRPPSDLELPEVCLTAVLGQKASDYSEGRLGPAPYSRGNASLPDSAGGAVPYSNSWKGKTTLTCLVLA